MSAPDPEPDARFRDAPPFIERACIGTLLGCALMAGLWLVGGAPQGSVFDMYAFLTMGSAATLAGAVAAVVPFRQRWLTLAVYLPALALVIGMVGVVRMVRDERPGPVADYDCDAAPAETRARGLRGWASEQQVHVLSGQIVPVEARPDATGAPSATLALVPSEGSARYGIQLSSDRPGLYGVKAVYRGRQAKHTIEECLDMRVPLDQPLPFELRWSGRWAVLRVGDDWLRRREIDFRPDKVRLSCSTGRARFEELWRDHFALSDPAELGRVYMGSFSAPTCGPSDELQLNLIFIKRGTGPEVAGVSITNCEAKPLRLVARSTRFTLQEREGETWRTKRDLTPYLCCNRSLGILDPDEDWSLSGLPSGLDTTHRLRFQLEVAGRVLHTEEFGPGSRR